MNRGNDVTMNGEREKSRQGEDTGDGDGVVLMSWDHTRSEVRS